MWAEQCVRGGKFCRWRHQLPGEKAIQAAKSRRFIGFFAMAQGLLIHRGEK